MKETNEKITSIVLFLKSHIGKHNLSFQYKHNSSQTVRRRVYSSVDHKNQFCSYVDGRGRRHNNTRCYINFDKI